MRLFKFQEAEPEFGPNGDKLEPHPSEVGHVVADKISSRVVIMVMALIILLPMLTYHPAAQHQRLGLKLFNKLHADPNAASASAGVCSESRNASTSRPMVLLRAAQAPMIMRTAVPRCSTRSAREVYTRRSRAMAARSTRSTNQ